MANMADTDMEPGQIEQGDEEQEPNKDDNDEEPPDGLQNVLFIDEEVPAGSKREFAKHLLKSFRSCQIFMTILCRLPIVCFETEDHSIVFEYHWSSVKGNLFFITFAILAILTLLSTINMASIWLDFPRQPETIHVTWDRKVVDGNVEWAPIFDVVNYNGFPKWALVQENETVIVVKDQKILRAEELFIFRRNLAPLLMVIFPLYHILTSDWNLYRRRHFVASYLTIWTENVELMKIDAAGEAKKYVKLFLTYYIIWILVFCVAIASNAAPVASGAPVAFVITWVRCFYPAIHTVPDTFILVMRAIGGFVYLFSIICSKAYVLFYLYICKILRTACTVWNERLERVFSEEERAKQRKEKCASRTGYDHLFKDYVRLLDLLSGADTVFTNIIESYYSMTVISIVFEVYYLVRPVSESQTEFEKARTVDMFLVLIYICNSVMVCYLVSTGAAEVGEASADGLEIIRRQGIMGHRTDAEMHFMISLYMSYTGHFDTSLSGGGYFILDKPFFVALAGTMVSYIIIIFQFQPALGLTDEDDLDLIGTKDDIKGLVLHMENTFYYVEEREPGT